MNNILVTRRGEMVAAVLAHKQLILDLFLDHSQLGRNEIREKLFGDLEKLKKFTGQTTGEINELLVTELVKSGHLDEVDKFNQNPQYQLGPCVNVLASNTSFGVIESKSGFDGYKTYDWGTKEVNALSIALYFPFQTTLKEFRQSVRDYLSKHGNLVAFDVVFDEFFTKHVPAGTDEVTQRNHAMEIFKTLIRIMNNEGFITSPHADLIGLVPENEVRPTYTLVGNEEIQQPNKEFNMAEQVIDPKEFQTALEIIALEFTEEKIKQAESEFSLTMSDARIRHGWYKAVRGLILDHAFEFRLSKPKDDSFGIPKEICKVQITKTICPMDAWQIKAAFELFCNEGH